MHVFDLSLDRITKVEGAASLEVRIKDGKVEHVHFKINEYKRFFTKAMEGKPVITAPQLLARICGTCSNAHLLCSIEACENALGIVPSSQTMLLRHLTMYGLMIRDHALHLYLFAMPDFFGKDSFLDFDENDPQQHQMLHDGFNIKAAGNYLASVVAGRSVHAVYPTIGGFTNFPTEEELAKAVEQLKKIRPAVLRLVEFYKNTPFHLKRGETTFMALKPERFGFLKGEICTNKGDCVSESMFREHLERVVLSYSQASAYEHKGEAYMVGALARLNLAKDLLHPDTRKDTASALELFPSDDIFHNNLAQAIEILHAIDDSLEIISKNKFTPEPIIKKPPRAAVGIGVIEAPRGTLYHKVEIDSKGIIKNGEVIVPTGQNQINIERDIVKLVQELIPHTPKEQIIFEIEKLIRAYDPCMSCAAHFLKVKWREA